MLYYLLINDIIYFLNSETSVLITKGFANMIEHKYLKLDEVVAMLKVSRNWFYKMRKAGKFVKPAIERPMRWRLDQINNFLDGAE